MKLVYDVEDKPKFFRLLLFALQQMLAILAATIAVPMIIGNGLTPAAAMFGAGVGTITYLIFTKRKSPVFLGSSFAFINPMFAAFAGGVSMSLGWLGLILGGIFAGLVYVAIAYTVRRSGVNWLYKLMPAVVIGPTVSLIGLSLARNAVADLVKGDVTAMVTSQVAALVDGQAVLQEVTSAVPVCSTWIAMLCGLVTLGATMLCSTYGKRMVKLIPFIIGILCGYAVAALSTLIGIAANVDALKIVDFGVFTAYMGTGDATLSTFLSVPDFTFTKAFTAFGELNFKYVLSIFAAYVPVAFVTFAEHVADHRNLSTIINRDLIKEPGLDKTLLGDGVGSMVGAFFGGCPNTTYGESVACVAITGNASTLSILVAAIGCILLSFVTPFVAFVDSIPSCVMGGVCIALYGFIAVSGLKMLQKTDLDDNSKLFVVSTILVLGIGGLSLSVGGVTVTEIATALIFGILANLMLTKRERAEEKAKAAQLAEAEKQATIEEPAEVEEPAEAEETAEIEESAETEESVEAEEPMTTEELEEVKQTVDAEEPAEIEESVTTEEPTEAEQPIEAEQPTETEQQAEPEESPETEESATTEEPAEVEQTVDAEEPTETEESVETEEPAAEIEESTETEESAMAEEPTESEE
ncbi:MAG: uracil-xanthine permease family protein [Christensenellales bacterium]